MSWDHRVVRRKHDNGDFTFGIHEVYYRYDGGVGEPYMVTETPVGPFGLSVEELLEDAKMLLRAFDKPVLEYDYIVGERKS